MILSILLSSYIDAQSVNCLEEAIFFEARGESLEGQFLVAQVIKNRVNHKRFPSSYCGVVHQNRQFSYKYNQKTYQSDLKSRRKAAIVAVVTMVAPVLSPTNMVYYTTTESNYFKNRLGVSKSKTLGHHTFYLEV